MISALAKKFKNKEELHYYIGTRCKSPLPSS